MNKRLLSRIVGWVIAFFLVFLLGRIVLSHWNQVKTFHWNIDYSLATVSIPFILFSVFWNAYIFYRVLCLQGVEIEYKSVFKITTITNLGTYIPGRIWGWLGLAYYSKKVGLSYTIMGTGVVISQILNIILNLLYGSMALHFIPKFNPYSWVIFFTIPIAILFIHPRFINHWVNLILRIFKRPLVKFDFSFMDIIKIGCLGIIGLISQGIAFTLFSNSIISLPMKGTMATLFLFSLSYVIGYLSIFVPGGIGVREGIITYGLSFFMPVHFAIIVAFGYRLLFLIVRMIPTILALKIPFSDSIKEAG